MAISAYTCLGETMKKLLILIIPLFCITGCSHKEVVTIIENDKELISINYPVTNVGALDDAVSSYVNQIYTNFKKGSQKEKTPELNISYTYKELNESVINISLNTEIKTDKKINKIKTFTYDKNTHKFLSI